MKKLVILIIILAIGCSSTVGQKLPPGNYVSATDGKPKRVVLKHIILDYKTSLDKQQNTVNADGKISFIPEKFENSASLDRIHVKAHLLDQDYTIIREVSFNAVKPLSDLSPVPFKITFPFDEKYRYVAFSYRINYFR